MPPKGLFAKKPFKVGDVIFKDKPLVTAVNFAEEWRVCRDFMQILGLIGLEG